MSARRLGAQNISISDGAKEGGIGNGTRWVSGKFCRRRRARLGLPETGRQPRSRASVRVPKVPPVKTASSLEKGPGYVPPVVLWAVSIPAAAADSQGWSHRDVKVPECALCAERGHGSRGWEPRCGCSSDDLGAHQRLCRRCPARVCLFGLIVSNCTRGHPEPSASDAELFPDSLSPRGDGGGWLSCCVNRFKNCCYDNEASP